MVGLRALVNHFHILADRLVHGRQVRTLCCACVSHAVGFAGTEVPSHSLSVDVRELNFVLRVQTKLSIHHMLTKLKDLWDFIYVEHDLKYLVAPMSKYLTHLEGKVSSSLGQ